MTPPLRRPAHASDRSTPARRLAPHSQLAPASSRPDPASSQLDPASSRPAPSGGLARVDAGGTTWRLRSLIAMGHDCARIARALGAPPDLVRRVVAGQAATITPAFRDRAVALWDAWWDKTPPQRTAAERRAAARALRRAQSNDWPAAAGLDEDLLDIPGYRPWCRYRPATGTGAAPDFPPAQTRQPRPAREIA